MTTRYYLSSDASAPVFSMAVASSYFTILDACLVNGYGSKPSLGWTIPYTGTNVKTYRSGGTGTRHFLRVFNNSAFVCNWRAFQTMSDANTGTDAYPNTSQVSGEGLACNLQSNNGNNNCAWALVGNEYFFHLSLFSQGVSGSSMTTGFQAVGANGYYTSMMFGRFKSFVAGDVSNHLIWTSNTQTAANSMTAAGSMHTTSMATLYAAGDAQNNVKSISLGRHFMGAEDIMGGAAGYAYADPHSASLRLQSKCRLFESNLGSILWRGEMPGLALPLSDIRPIGASIVVGSGSLDGRTFFALPLQGSPSRIAYHCYDTGEWGN